MVIKILGIVILVHGLMSSLFAQSNLSNNHCDNSEGVKINSPHEFISDSLYVSYSESAGGLNLKIINTTNQTVYLFSSYFQESDHSSKYLHRINKKAKLYKIAFLPLLPYLSTKSTDKRILGEDRMVNKGQILYNFIKLEPQTFFDIDFSYSELFKNLDKKKSLVRDFNENNKFNNIRFKYLSASQLKGKYKLVFEFAVYDHIDILCEESAYYLKEVEFDLQAKSFRILSVPIKIKNYDHRLF